MTRATLYVTLLRETKERPRCGIPALATSSRTGRSLVEELLLELEGEGALTLEGQEIVVSPGQRMRIAEIAVGLGTDPERVARQLRWQEFEALADRILCQAGYGTTTRFVFKCSGLRFEIDVLGAKEPLVLCIDCKHWQYGWAPSRIAAAAKDQVRRVEFLSQVFRRHENKLSTVQWKSVQLLPILLTLADVSSRMVDGVPVVSALRFGTFLSEVGPSIEKLRYIDARVS